MNFLLFTIPLGWSLLALVFQKRFQTTVYQMKSNDYPFKYLIVPALFLYPLFPKRIQNTVYQTYLSKFKQLFKEQAHIHVSLLFPAHTLTILILVSSCLIAFGYAMEALDFPFFLFVLVVCVVILVFQHREWEKKIQRRQQEIISEFPAFLTRISILSDSGIPLLRALEIICLSNTKKTAWKSELDHVFSEIQVGISLTQALENLARRVKLTEVTKFVSFVVQHQKKGNRELSSLLRLLAQECWESKKRLALKLGEEASAKLIFPMILILLSILLLVATPAILSMLSFK